MSKEKTTILSIVMPTATKISLQQYAPIAELSNGRRGASGVIMAVMEKFMNNDGTINVEKLEKFLKSEL